MIRPTVLAIAFILSFIATAAGAAPSLTLSAVPGARSLHLGGTGNAATQIRKVAVLRVSSENPAGCTVTLLATALSKDDGYDSIALQVFVVERGDPVPQVSDFTRVPDGSYAFTISAGGTHYRDVYVRYLPRAIQDPGIYSSSITAIVSDH